MAAALWLAALGVPSPTPAQDASALPDPETLTIMPFVEDSSYCRKCHSAEETELADPSQACSTYCVSCHEDKSAHHTVGAALPGEQPRGLALSRRGLIACTTCHDLRTRRFDSVPWKSESLFGRVFRRAPRYKTYYLVIRNNKGQLCRECH